MWQGHLRAVFRRICRAAEPLFLPQYISRELALKRSGYIGSAIGFRPLGMARVTEHLGYLGFWTLVVQHAE